MRLRILGISQWSIENEQILLHLEDLSRRAGKLYRARSRLYRSQIFRVITHVKALADIYTIHCLHLYTPLHRFECNLKTLKSASGQRHQGEKQSPGEEKNRPQQCNEVWRMQRREGAKGTLL